MTKILVTGGTGFLGTHLVRHLRSLALEHEVRTVSRRRISGEGGRGFIFYRPTGEDRTGHYDEGLQHFSFDLTDRMAVKRMFYYYQPDIIFHLAANPMVKNPEGIFRDNVEVTQNLLKYCSENCRFIFASSIVVYGDCNQYTKSTEKDLPKPTSEYGITKLASEHLVNMFTSRGKVNGVNLRLCATVGSGLTHGVIFDFIKKLQNDPVLEVLGSSPGSTKPYLYIDDAIRAFMLMFNKDYTGSWNVVPDNEASIHQLARAVMSGLDIDKEIKWLGDDANWAGDNKHLCAANRQIKSMGWKLDYESSFDAIKQCVKGLQ